MTSPRTPVERWRVLFLVFFASGLSGLVYESIWSRYVKQLVGSAATAQILVLVLFMGGMSLGAVLAGRFLHRLRMPVVVYGLIEGLVGLYALAFPHLFELATRVAYDVLFPALGGSLAVGIAKWVLAGLLILPPCVMLGTTFPLMSVGILRRDPHHGGEVLALLYFSNSLGAAVGALVSGFVLVPTVGLPGALMVAAALNVLIMLVAVRDREPAPPIAGETQPESAEARRQVSWMVWLYLAVAGGTGLSSFMYEIGWIRLLSMILGSATHSFEVMLSAFVFGLSLGGLWVRKRMDQYRRPEMVLAVVQLVMGASAIATLPAYWIAVQAMGLLLRGDVRTDALWIGFNVLRYLLCLLVMLPATFCAGMTLPLLTHVMLRRGQPEGTVGTVYAVNTLGAIVGATLAGLVLMPLVRLKGVIVLGALLDMLLGLALVRGELRLGRGNRLTPMFLSRAGLATVFVVTAGLLVPMSPSVLTSTVFRKGRTSLPDDFHILSYVDGRTASVTVIENRARAGYRNIYTNGKPDATVVLDRWPEGRDPELGPDIAGDEPNQFLVGLVPLMVRPDATHAALIGFGSGVTCHTMLGSPVLERLDTIEIEREMVRGSQFFMPVNYRAFTDPRSHLWYDDAKAYFAAAGLGYDIIVSEPTNPWVSGVSSLFTIEFYREVKRYLKPGGVLAQWIQGYELSDALLGSVLAAIDREFADYLVVRIGERDWVILSRPDAPIGPLDPEPLAWPGTREAFELLGIHDVGQVDGLIAANRRILHPYFAERTPNRDAMPILDTGAERTRFFASSAEFLHELRFTPAPIVEVLGRIPRRPYPREGIGDLRDPHILRENEQAVYLMRRFEDPNAKPAAKLSAAAMDHYRKTRDALGDEATWWSFMTAVYEVYRQTASHLDVHETAWWRDVKQAVTSTSDVPESIVFAIELLDALSAKDGERLTALVNKTLPREDFPLPLSLRATAGLVALELQGEGAERRQAFVDAWMRKVERKDDSAGVAYDVLEAFADRE